MSELTADYWSQRYQEKNTPWDLGNVSPAIKEYMDRWPKREARILIPGAGPRDWRFLSVFSTRRL
jgi:thiopurine S-methyltransferase